MDRDGTNDGYDLPLTSAVAGAVPVPVIASGGAGTLEHLVDALRAGADAVLCASIFHYGTYTIAQAKEHLAAAGIAVRPAFTRRSGAPQPDLASGIAASGRRTARSALAASGGSGRASAA